MNVYHRPAEARGHADYGWLDTRHTFSFGNYYDPAHMGFGPLRVINEDTVQPGGGFGAHGHRDMEILTYVLEGALAHRDSLGNGSEIRPGDVQRMTAGTGIRHSEFNASDEEPVRFLQIWIEPAAQGMEPGYEQIRLAPGGLENRLQRLASPDGGEGQVRVHQDVSIYGALLSAGNSAAHDLEPGRRLWVQVIDGQVDVASQRLKAGDGLGLDDTGDSHRLSFEAREDSHLLLFDINASPDR